MAEVTLPEPDRVEGAPHPRDTRILFGHDRAEAAFLDAFHTGRLHHGWLITGPRGVGKATLAWRIARFLLAQEGGMFPPDSLEVEADHPVARRIAALSEPRLFLLRRGANATGSALSADIRVDEVRKMKSFFTLSAADGGRRVAIVDAADELAPAGANALLKLLEEPPPGVTLILVSHQPSRLLPTIRSRCRELRLSALEPAAMQDALVQAGAAVEDPVALAELGGGSVGEAVRLLNLDGLVLYRQLVDLLGTLPRLDRGRALALAEAGTGRGNEARFDLIVGLIDRLLARMARAGTLGALPPEAAKGESDLLERLSPTPRAALAWAELQQTLGHRARQGKAVNLDPAALLMDMVLKIDETAATLARTCA
ncbi:DNA polymerase III subunit delta' [Falsirhodobacter sp. 20TX0035]|uniref:DNA polymerase III subunit delta' n=1 Tax=Falsirhodobacter sp. 20TX0035 TaxID=3022019 RepID=UPI0023307523|nr:DNA polymerase III subunit delta' [Falsirhodobacter sp. 20TX0035]MDB6453672.1 DNA polymerase III subunit delta' [Falsirhodobacter sp. 20TX0035]